MVQGVRSASGTCRRLVLSAPLPPSTQNAVLWWLRANGGGWDADACAEAAKGGNLRLLKWMRSKGCPWNEKTAENAAREMRVPVLSWAFRNGAPFDAKAVKGAVLDEKIAEKRSHFVALFERLTRELGKKIASAA